MAPRKGTTQGKSNNSKIKSKINRQKCGSQSMKKAKASDKPMDGHKWLNKASTERGTRQGGTVPNWPCGYVYKHAVDSRSSIFSHYGSDYALYTPRDEDRSTITEISEECNCSQSNYMNSPKCGILKRKVSSTNSIVAKYIKTGMDQVASFIVQSAIRFGEKHGVVVPDKNTPNVYEITYPNQKMDEKCQKIRFRIPEKDRTYEDKRLMWKKQIKNARNGRRRDSSPIRDKYDDQVERSASKESTSDSLDEIIPLLEKLEDGETDIVNSELDLNQFAMKDGSEDNDKKERMRKRLRTIEKRLRNVRAMSEKGSERGYPSLRRENHWRRFKRDSLELGRQRLRASSCPRKQEPNSPSPY